MSEVTESVSMQVNISNSEESHYFSLVIRTVNNDSYNISGLTSDTPVHDLKSQIQNILAIDVDRQRLIYRGHVLDNESTIGRYNIEEGHCVHVVARPENMPVITPSSQPEEGNESLVNRAATNGRRFTGSPFPMGLLSPLLGLASIGRANNSEIVVNPSLEHVRQSILTVNTLASTLSSHRIVNSGISVSSTRTFGTYDNSNAEEKHDESKYRRVGSTIGEEEKHFYIGQWVDVKDTVNQWLAATVMDIDCDAKKLFVHFNGWPVRWDEWIDWNSNRISPFRSFSAQEISSLSLSPTLSAREASTMITGRDDIRILLPEVHSISQNLSPLLHSLSELSIRSLAASSSAQSISDSARAPHSMPWQEHHAPFQCLETTPPIDQQAETDLRHLAAELSPLLDRFGRLLSDLSPYVRLLANSPLPSDTPVEVPENTATSASPSLSINQTEVDGYRRILGAAGRQAPFPGLGGHLDIHIHAILASSPVLQNIPTLDVSAGASAQQGTPADNMRMHEDDDVNDNEEEEALPLLEEGDSEHGYNFEEVD